METTIYQPSRIGNNSSIYFGDCLQVMSQLHKEGVRVDLVLADPPYGTTHCRWDSVIDFNKMWQGIDKLSYPSTPVLLFCQQPFTCSLGNSNIKNLRYSWVWEKTTGTGFLNAKKMPMKYHEDILVFYRKLPIYNPVMTDGHNRKIISANHKRKCNQGDIYQDHSNFSDYDSTTRYPRSVLKFKTDKQTNYLHPTQKPVSLLKYFIETYTNIGGVVLDFTMGSGSTGVACIETGRGFIGIDNDPKCFNITKDRLIKCL